MTTSSTKNGSNGVHPDAAITPEHDLLWDSLSPKGGDRAGEAPRPEPGLPAQGTGRAQLQLHRGPHRHRPGEPHLRVSGLGL